MKLVVVFLNFLLAAALVPSRNDATEPTSAAKRMTESSIHRLLRGPAEISERELKTMMKSKECKPAKKGNKSCSKAPSPMPTPSPSSSPSTPPTSAPSVSAMPSAGPSGSPSSSPSKSPSEAPSTTPSSTPSAQPSAGPSMSPSASPSVMPSRGPTSSSSPSTLPSAWPSKNPSSSPSPSTSPSAWPSFSSMPSTPPSASPSTSAKPSFGPSGSPSSNPSPSPSVSPSAMPSASPSAMPSLVPSSVPTITPPRMVQGDTFPVKNGQLTNAFVQSGDMSFPNVVCGAVQAVLAHPTDPNVCFAGAVNGGVWRSFNCLSDLPDWQPLTDTQESLSIGDMVFDESDPTRNTVLAGIGTRSSLARSGGPGKVITRSVLRPGNYSICLHGILTKTFSFLDMAGIGLLYSNNALSANPTWTVLDNTAGSINFRTNQVKFNSVFARRDFMMASAFLSDPYKCENVGIYRSLDHGTTWTKVLTGVGQAIASDPNDPARFYATLDYTNYCSGAVASVNGVFTSNDWGATWAVTAVVPGTDPWKQGELNNAKLSVSADGSRVWSALLRNGVADSISYSDDNGASWTVMDEVLTPNLEGDPHGLNPREKPGSQGSIHFSLFASPTNQNEIYVGGDRQSNPFPNYIGAVTYSGRLFRGDASVNATDEVPSPQWKHLTDSNVVEDIPGGGTASSSAPHADCRDMELRADGSILEGDDGGIVIRTRPTDNTGDWFSICGNLNAFETHNVAYEPLFGSVLFGTQDNGSIFGTLGIQGTFNVWVGGDGNDCMIDFTSHPSVIYYYMGTQNYGFFVRVEVDKTTGSVIASSVKTLPGRGSFVSVAAMNPSSQNEFAVAITSPARIAFSHDRGDSFTPVTVPLPNPISAMAWSVDGMYLYAVGEPVVSYGPPFLVRCQRASPLTCLPVPMEGTLSGFIRHLAVDHDDNERIVAAVVNSRYDFRGPRAFISVDGGTGWTDITVAGSLLDSAALGGAVVYLGNTIAFGTSNGVLVPDGGVGAGWRLLAAGLPKVAILDMVYESLDDTLVVATLGRGVWFLEGASAAPIKSGRFMQELDEPRRSHVNFASAQSVMGDLVVPPDSSPDDMSEFEPLP